MPLITIPMLFLLAGAFSTGCLVAWFVAERKHERARTKLESSMTRALEKRYAAYEDLEQSFHRIFGRMEEARERWQEQMAAVKASVEGSLGQTSFVREGVEELVERVDAMGAELHSKMEAVLELAREASAARTAQADAEQVRPAPTEPTPDARPLEVEPTHLLMRVENPELWDLERAFERRSAEQLAEISAKSQRVGELMDKLDALEPLAQQLAERDREYVTLEDAHRALQTEVEGLMGQVRELETERDQLTKTRNALEETRRVRMAELTHRVQQLEDVEVEAAELRKQITAQRAQRDQHDAEQRTRVTELECKLAEVGVELEAVREQHSTAIEVAADERIRFEEQLDLREQEVVGLRDRIAELERRAASLNSEVSSRDEILADKEERLNELQAELGKLQTELEERAAELDERERRLQEVQSAWQQATGQVESQRSRLQAHLGSFHAAQEMLAQLKPMLRELETRLSSDDDEPTVVVTDELSDQSAMVVYDGTDDDPDPRSRRRRRRGRREVEPEQDVEPRQMSLDEPLAPLPKKAPDMIEEEPELSAADFDLSGLDEEQDR